MKKPEKWKPSKYEMHNGQLRGTRNPSELAVSSRFVADMTADFYNRAIPLHAKGRIVDLGCGKAPLYGFYKDYCTDIVLTDWPGSTHENECLDLACNLTEPLPFEDEKFDTILLSDVLEHIPNPMHLWSEMYRLLRPGGKILLNTPFYYRLHETPYDFYRFTEYALRNMAESVGFKIVELEAFGGILQIILDLLSKRFSTMKHPGKLLALLFQKLAEKKKNDALKKTGRKTYPLGYFMIAEKQDSKNGT